MNPRALQDTHDALADILGPSAEPIDVLRVAERHREFWRPDTTSVVLLAESHVYTTPAELERTLRPLPELPNGLPRGFVRLVYSLGYGENVLLDRPINTPRNAGTPQYWKIFQSCLTPVGSTVDCTSMQASRTPDARSRLAAKLRALKTLRARGVWLLDASVAALYNNPGQPKPSPRTCEAALHASWDRYVAGIVETAAPEAVLCIGVGVARSLRTRLERLAIPWAAVPQPQAHLARYEHEAIHRIYSAVCADPRQICSVPSVL
jgi:hypothetical protein